MIQELNSGCFLYENYESNWWSIFDLSYADSMSTKTIADCIKQFATGYCRGESLLFRPRQDSMAVMFEKGQDRFWFHIPNWQFDSIFKDENAPDSNI